MTSVAIILGVLVGCQQAPSAIDDHAADPALISNPAGTRPPPGFPGTAEQKHEPVELGDGLVVEDLVFGFGPSVAAADSIIAGFRLSIKGGAEVEVISNDNPFVKLVSRLYPGYARGVIGMKPGGTRRISIPAKLGFGARGLGKKIPPNSDLVLETTVLKVLKVEDLLVGTGADVDPGGTVTFNYTAKLATTGAVFDSSTADASKGLKGGPMTVNLNDCMDGFKLGIPGCNVGGKRKLSIPWELAFGEKGDTRLKVPTRSDVTYEIEILDVKPMLLPNGQPARFRKPKPATPTPDATPQTTPPVSPAAPATTPGESPK